MTTPIKIGINGFGRIGRVITRLAQQNKQIEIVGINDLTDLNTVAHLLKYDSVHGRFGESVVVEGNGLIVGGKKIAFTAERDPSKLPWAALKADIVFECTGVFTKKEQAANHLKAGAKRVVISAPSPDPDATLCMGVNHEIYDPSKHVVVSNASCTTNCLAPLAKVIDTNFGIVNGMMLTVHSYTNDQNILDLPHKDLRRARAAALSQIPTTTGAAKAVGLVLPHLKGKIDGISIRVPTPNVSMIDFTCTLKKSTTRDEVNRAFETASNTTLKGILGYEKAPLVSTDYNGNTLSSTIDAELTNVIDGNLLKVISWYDNESGFSQRMIDLASAMAAKGI